MGGKKATGGCPNTKGRARRDRSNAKIVEKKEEPFSGRLDEMNTKSKRTDGGG